MPGSRGRTLGGVLAGVLAVVAVSTGCDAGSTTTPTTTPGPPSSAASSSVATTPAPADPTPDTSTPPTEGPATPTAPPGTFAIAVSGAGQVTYPVTGVRCDAATVTGTAAPAGGGDSGTVTLDVATGVVTVAGLPPLDGTRLTGSTDGTPTAGGTVRWTGDATGSAASLTVVCS